MAKELCKIVAGDMRGASKREYTKAKVS